MARVGGFLALLAVGALGKNPIVPNVGMADPHIHVFRFNGTSTFYLYATHDFAPNNTGFLMKNWWVWSSPDLVDWTLEAVLDPQQTPATPSEYDECWATDGAEKDGSYYFYLSMGPTEIGVMRSTVSPTGPWENVIGVPLINASVGQELNTQSRDPCAFQDDDGSYYLIFGTFNYYIAKLGDDMQSFAEPFRPVVVNNPTGPYGAKTDDKPFMHKHGGVYYLSWGCFYATGSSPYGPFTYAGAPGGPLGGSVVDSAAIAPDFRMNVTAGPWYGWEDYADRHGSFWQANGQWYYAANDRSHSTDAKNPSVYRDTVIAYLDFFANGTMAPVTIDATGVGEYDGRSLIPAHHFFSLEGSGAHKGHDDAGGFAVHGISPETRLAYPHIRGVPRTADILLRVATAAAAVAPGLVVSVRLGSAAGPEVCRAALPATGGLGAWADVRCVTAKPLPTELSAVLVFEAEEGVAEEGAIKEVRLASLAFEVAA